MIAQKRVAVAAIMGFTASLTAGNTERSFGLADA